ncbi:MAG: leucine-rich repeat protein [Ruminococcus sp.]|nr:leucine-rich repeat protein [Ruminococcus sp.]
MNFNKIFAVIMAVCVMGFGVPYVNAVAENNSVITASAKDYTEGTYEQLIYTNYGDYIEISDCDESAETVVIPAEIDGVSVTSIGASAFVACNSLTSINIPNSVISIGGSAFFGCKALTSIEIPDSVTNIGKSAFYNCMNLTSLELPESITSIRDSVFYECSSLTSIEIPDSVTSIGNSVFYGCSSLTSIEIPDSVTNIGMNVFYGTPWLKAKQAENPLVVINNILINGETCKGDVVIPDGVTSIASYAFERCNLLTSIEIPDSVTSIGEGAFRFCFELKEITILNPECEIYGSNDTIFNYNLYDYDSNSIVYYFNGTIKGYENSTAQAYAKKYRRKFVSLDKATDKETATGDINGDNKVGIADAVLFQEYILGRYELTEEQFKNADLTGDGFVDSFDMILLRRMIIENNK